MTLTGEPQSSHPASRGMIPPPRPLRQVKPRGVVCSWRTWFENVNRAMVEEDGAENVKPLTPRPPLCERPRLTVRSRRKKLQYSISRAMLQQRHPADAQEGAAHVGG